MVNPIARICTVDGCEKPSRAPTGRGWCSMHNERWARSGTTDDLRTPPEVRFWRFVDTSGGPNACHPWIGGVNEHGYGRFNPGNGPVLSTRWMLAHTRGGPLARHELVCHRCDNPPCVNPLHLFVGSHAENMRDAVMKGRLHPRSKVSDEQVAEIRLLCADGVSQREVAARFGLGQPTVSQIVTGRRRVKAAT